MAGQKKKKLANARTRNGVDVSKYIRKNPAQPSGKTYQVKHSFKEFGLDHRILDCIEQQGYKAPTEIQDKSIRPIMDGMDLIGIAGTGTGKTAAFLLPIIQGLIAEPKDQKALIIAPTRELATQIFQEFRKLTRGMKLYATTLIGGTNVGQCIKDLRRTNHLVIGTPGRIMDMADRKALTLDKFDTLVLDEFDRMLDMGFSKDVMKIYEKMQRLEQVMLFSATLDKTQEKLISEITIEPVRVTAGPGMKHSDTIEQNVIRVSNGVGKMDILTDLILEREGEKIILFCETKRRVERVFKHFKSSGIPVDMIHGDKTQSYRDKALGRFKGGTSDVLIATDVVARGIDVDNVALVINDEIPRNYNDYIHRIGRTGRAGKSGKAITLVSN